MSDYMMGGNKTISIKKYQAMPQEQQDNWLPVYTKYKKKYFTDYCPECGHGTRTSQDIGVGDPIKYTNAGPLGALGNKMARNMAENLNNSNVLFERSLNPKKAEL